MKKILLSVSDNVSRGTGYSDFSFDFDDLVRREKASYDRLSDHDKKETEYVTVTEYELEISDDYNVTTENALVLDLFNDEIECPQFSSGWFDDSAIVRQIDIV